MTVAITIAALSKWPANRKVSDALRLGLVWHRGVHQIRLKKISQTMHPMRIARLEYTIGRGHR